METVTFSTDDGLRLEWEIRRPEGDARATAIVCHPHPKHGGSKDHPILWAVRNELAGRRSIIVLGFNFRGVMGSGGTYGGGRDELHDARAAIGRVRDEAPELPTIACGWSFGASVALREALDDPRVAALALIGFPLRPKDLELPPAPHPSELQAFRRPVLVLAGVKDEYCPVNEARAFSASLPDGRFHAVEGADHYLWRREREAAGVVGAFVDEVLAGRGRLGGRA